MGKIRITPTADVDQFIFDDTNRDISTNHVNRLAEEIASLNLLDLYPVVVTHTGVAFDGQHRIKACEIAELPLYKIDGGDIDIDDIQMANSATVKYTIKDLLHVYKNTGHESYKWLSNVLKGRDRIGAATVAKWGYSSFSESAFAHGDLLIDRSFLAERAADFLADISITIAHVPGGGKWVLTSKPYRNACFLLAQYEWYDHGRFIERLKVVPQRLVNCGTTEEAIGIINHIYNYNKSKANVADLSQCLHAPVRRNKSGEIIYPKLSPSRTIPSDKAIDIASTNDYKIFSIHPAARPLCKTDSIMKSVEQKNMLRFFPIIVNSEMVVFDGQRRLYAARKLQYPIHFIVADDIDMDMIAIAGGITKKWTMRDYLDRFVKLGYQNYIKIKEILEQDERLNLDTIMCATLAGHRTPGIKYNTDFKHGTFEPDIDAIVGIRRALDVIADEEMTKNYKVQKILVFTLPLVQWQKSAYARLCSSIRSLKSDILGSSNTSYLVDLAIASFNKGLPASSRISR